MVSHAFPTPDRLVKAKSSLSERLLKEPPWLATEVASALGTGERASGKNIVGVGIGRKYVAGQTTRQMCLRVYVVQKVLPELVGKDYLVKPIEEDVPTDVIQVGDITPFQNKTKFAFTPGGASVGHKNVGSGTLACLVTSATDVYMLSNNHVFVDGNTRSAGGTDDILHPGPADGANPSTDVIGTLYDFEALQFNAVNAVDLALAKPSDVWHRRVAPFILQIGEIRGRRQHFLDMSVKKMGRTTRLTQGEVDDIDADIWVRYEVRSPGGYTTGRAKFEHQIAIRGTSPGRPFSRKGDSGSLILDQHNFATGLLFAGSEEEDLTYANPIASVIDTIRKWLGNQADLWMFPW